MKIQPLHNYVHIKRANAVEKRGSIIVPEVAKMPAQRATVLGIGADVKCCNVGDSIVLAKHAGIQFEMDGEDIELIIDKDILYIEKP